MKTSKPSQENTRVLVFWLNYSELQKWALGCPCMCVYINRHTHITIPVLARGICTSCLITHIPFSTLPKIYLITSQHGVSLNFCLEGVPTFPNSYLVKLVSEEQLSIPFYTRSTVEGMICQPMCKKLLHKEIFHKSVVQQKGTSLDQHWRLILHITLMAWLTSTLHFRACKS